MASRLRLAAHATAATVAVAALLASYTAMHSSTRQASASAKPGTSGPYAALGDSYTSGAGIPDAIADAIVHAVTHDGADSPL